MQRLVEMRPNETKRSNMDLCMGEIFYLKSWPRTAPRTSSSSAARC